MGDVALYAHDSAWGAEMVNRSSGKFLGVDAVGWLEITIPNYNLY